MPDPRLSLTPDQVHRLWRRIDCDTSSLRAEYLGSQRIIPGASTLTHACIWTSAAVLVDAGLRPTELVTLVWSDIQHLEGPQAWVNISATNSKSHRARQISCTARLTTRLRVHLELQRKATTPNPSHVLHAYPAQAAPLTTRTLHRWISTTVSLELQTVIRPYDLRHTYATILLSVADIETVRLALGHRHISTTQQYLHTQSETHRAAAGAFETRTNGD